MPPGRLERPTATDTVAVSEGGERLPDSVASEWSRPTVTRTALAPRDRALGRKLRAAAWAAAAVPTAAVPVAQDVGAGADEDAAAGVDVHLELLQRNERGPGRRARRGGLLRFCASCCLRATKRTTWHARVASLGVRVEVC